LREGDPGITRGALWLGAPEYVAWRLAGSAGTDFSLAGRTYAFDLQQREWDAPWLAFWGLEADLFPPAQAAGTPAGAVGAAGRALGLPAGVPVSVAGHDHVTAAYAAGVLAPEAVFDSMGTAETLVGTLPQRGLTAADAALGLIYGCHVLPETLYWMGALSASGGSVEWARALLGDEPLSYADFEALVEAAGPGPTGLLFFPYLVGSASPHRDAHVRGAIVGLGPGHGRAALARAVLEGAAYELEFARRVGEQAAGQPIRRLVAAGGGTRLRAWLQIKADVSGVAVERFAEPEATLLGAALLAGVGAGVYTDHAAALAAARRAPAEVIEPDPHRHARCRELFEHGYLRLQAPLRELGQWTAEA
jgi:sugar (pentulose or hexulose) kinase